MLPSLLGVLSSRFLLTSLPNFEIMESSQPINQTGDKGRRARHSDKTRQLYKQIDDLKAQLEVERRSTRGALEESWDRLGKSKDCERILLNDWATVTERLQRAQYLHIGFLAAGITIGILIHHLIFNL